jgi:hypothetical protein
MSATSLSRILEATFGVFDGDEDEYFRRLGKSKAFDFKFRGLRKATNLHDQLANAIMEYNSGVMDHVRMYGDVEEGHCGCCGRDFDVFYPIDCIRSFRYALDNTLDGHSLAISDSHFVMGNRVLCWKQAEPLVFVSFEGLVFDFNLKADYMGYYFLPGSHSLKKMCRVEKFPRCRFNDGRYDLFDVDGKVYVKGRCGLFFCRSYKDYYELNPLSKVCHYVDVGGTTVNGVDITSGDITHCEAERQGDALLAYCLAYMENMRINDPEKYAAQIAADPDYDYEYKVRRMSYKERKAFDASRGRKQIVDQQISESYEVDNPAAEVFFARYMDDDDAEDVLRPQFKLDVDSVLTMIPNEAEFSMGYVEPEELVVSPVAAIAQVIGYIEPVSEPQNVNEVVDRAWELYSRDCERDYNSVLGREILKYIALKYSLRSRYNMSDGERTLDILRSDLSIFWRTISDRDVNPDTGEYCFTVEYMTGAIYQCIGETSLVNYLRGVSIWFNDIILAIPKSDTELQLTRWFRCTEGMIGSLYDLGLLAMRVYTIVNTVGDCIRWQQPYLDEYMDKLITRDRDSLIRKVSAFSKLGWRSLVGVGTMGCVIRGLRVAKIKHRCGACSSYRYNCEQQKLSPCTTDEDDVSEISLD